MKKLILLIAILIGAGMAQVATADITKQDGQTVYKTDCQSIRIDLLAGAIQDIPDGTYSELEFFLELAARAKTMFPALTQSEKALCSGVAAIPKTWKVARRTGSTTRPYYMINADGTKQSTKSGDVDIGAPCGVFFAASIGGNEYRFLMSNPDAVAICEFR